MGDMKCLLCSRWLAEFLWHDAALKQLISIGEVSARHLGCHFPAICCVQAAAVDEMKPGHIGLLLGAWRAVALCRHSHFRAGGA